MFGLVLLISLIIGVILLDLDLLGISLALICFLIFLLFKKIKNKKVFIVSIALIGIGLAIGNIRLTVKNSDNLIALVTKKEDNYIILKTFKEKFYCYTKEDIKLYDIIKIDGYFDELNFKEYESSFSFTNYLNKNQNVYRSFKITHYEIIFDCPIDFISYKEKVLNRFSTYEAKEFVNSLLFGESDNESLLKETSSNLMITNLLSASGLFLNFILYGLSNIYYLFSERKTSRILSLITLLPFFFFNIYRFNFFRVLTLFIVNVLIYDKRKELDKFNITNFVYLIFLLFSPSLIYSPGFYLPLLMSFIFKFSNLALKSESKIIKAIKTKILVCFSFLPYSINSYGGFNVFSLIFNYTFTFIFKFLFLIAVLSFYGIYIGIFDDIYIFFYKMLISINFNKVDIYLPKLNSYLLVIYYLLFFIFIYFKEINFNKFIYLSGITFLSLLLIYCLPIKNLMTFKVSYINVGQGDSTLVRIKDKAFLIDTGGIKNYDLATNSLIPYLKRERIYKLEAVFITHYDFDHYGALESLKENFEIKNIYDYNATFPIRIGNIEINNLNTYQEAFDENDKSLVLDLNFKDNRFLFMGDATTKVENYLVKNYDLKADFLKLGHHGSNSSSSLEFLKEVDPEVGIISCGKNNSYGHPDSDVINRLKYLDIEIRRTDLEGTITYEFLA